MSSPCKECLVLPCCRSRLSTKRDIFDFGDECKLFHDYLIEFYDESIPVYPEDSPENRKLFLKFMEVRDIFKK